MSSMVERDAKSFIPGRDSNLMVTTNTTFHQQDPVVSEAHIPMNYVRDSWIANREKIFSMFPATTPNYAVFLETPAAYSLPILQPPPDSSTRDERVASSVEEPPANKEGVEPKKRQGGAAPKMPKAKKPKKPKENANSTAFQFWFARAPEPLSNVIDGACGWQSACCTTNVSMYPLPMSTKRRGARIAGQKMSQGAFKKVLEKLAAEDYNLSNPIDLRSHWARHGTNKFVTIR
ncbi:hypothetical protein CXB51_004515 [Gossypium anomalum]|uniref:GAGA-binding transcriptional activator n=1 Tax=Gossypium anomalum TaxID=47600 RepID=A0A8J5ZXT9_9ROSI|nr:hypothetical protein CXB51_004515 [Gossypium anomalum]